jgi:uncharacterized Zn-finger protein|tara:strand:- start:16 stop:300 length:285 start_codon:yes stop_codon:yes gene_type:complete
VNKSRATTYFLKKNRALKLFSEMFSTPDPAVEDTGIKVMTFLEEIYTDKDYIMCDNDHPVIYLQMGKSNYVICGYCNAKYIKKPKWGSTSISME